MSDERFKRAEEEAQVAQEAIDGAYSDLSKLMGALKKMAETKATYGGHKHFPKKRHEEAILRMMADYTHALKVFSDFHVTWREACDEFTDAAAERTEQVGGS